MRIDTNMAMPVERSRTVTTYNTDVRHDHKGNGNCTGKLIADDKEKDHPLLKVTAKKTAKRRAPCMISLLRRS